MRTSSVHSPTANPLHRSHGTVLQVCLSSLHNNDMKIMRQFFIASVLFAMFACDSSNDSSTSGIDAETTNQEVQQPATPTTSFSAGETAKSDDMHTSSTSIDWSGTYAGTIPCADCEGVEITMNLNDDLSFTAMAIYLGKSTSPFEARGSFTWLEDGARIQLSGIDPSAMPNIFKVGENKITCLDHDGNPITGKLNSRYTLKKI
jgi:uncharacterized lipoprotein NlpE involved in copper resistance